MDIRTTSAGRFIPKAMGNDKKPAGEQISVELEYPTMEGLEPYIGGSPAGHDTIGTIRRFVKRVWNLQENGEEVADGARLVKCRRHKFITELVNEIYVEIITKNRATEEQEKNSGGQSSSS